MTDGMSRRTLLRGAAGGAAVLAAGGLPPWARPVAQGARPAPARQPAVPAPAGGHAEHARDQHIVVLMMENHSFDNLLGMVPYQVPGPPPRRRPDAGATAGSSTSTPTRPAAECYATHAQLAVPAQRRAEPGLERQPHVLRQRPQRRLRQGERADRDAYWDKSTCRSRIRWPSTSRSASATSARCSRRPTRTGASSSPATASGTIATNTAAIAPPAANGTIFDRLDAHNIDWRIYVPGDRRAP